jgi:hypothetical protein
MTLRNLKLPDSRVERDMLKRSSIQMIEISRVDKLHDGLAGERRCLMNSHTQTNIQRMLAIATALVMIGAGLKVLVMQTLGSFDAASVILALYVGFWACVLGTSGLILLLTWLVAGNKCAFPLRFDASRRDEPCHAS